MIILGLCWCIFLKNEQTLIEWMIFCSNESNWVHREPRVGLKATTSQRVTNYHFIHAGICLLLFLSARVLFSLADYSQKRFSTFWTLWAWAGLNFEEEGNTPENLTVTVAPSWKKNLRKTKADQNTLDFDNNYLAHYTILAYDWLIKKSTKSSRRLTLKLIFGNV